MPPDASTLPEEWRPVVGWEDLYQVSNLGRVRNIADRNGTKVGKVLRPGRMTTGYFFVVLCRNSKKTNSSVSRLVAKAFLPPPVLEEVNHINSDRLDNRVTNLEWVTPAKNIRHKVLAGHVPTGESVHGARLTAEKARAIKALLREGSLSLPQIGARFGVHKATIWDIDHGLTWKHVV